jgi:hypothetical protein
MCRLPWNLGASTSWNPQGLSKPVMELLYLKTAAVVAAMLRTITVWMLELHDSSCKNSSEKNIYAILLSYSTINFFVPQRAYLLKRWWSNSCLHYLSWVVHFDPLPILPATVRDYLVTHPCAIKCKVRMTGKICIAQQRGSKVGSLRTVATWPAHLVVLGLFVITTSCDQ